MSALAMQKLLLKNLIGFDYNWQWNPESTSYSHFIDGSTLLHTDNQGLSKKKHTTHKHTFLHFSQIHHKIQKKIKIKIKIKIKNKIK